MRMTFAIVGRPNVGKSSLISLITNSKAEVGDYDLDSDDSKHNLDWKVTLIDTGYDTMTGGRLKRLESYIGDHPFMLTYGDGLADININELLDFHPLPRFCNRKTYLFEDLEFHHFDTFHPPKLIHQ